MRFGFSVGGALVALLGSVAPAFALSCLPPSIDSSFNSWAESPDTYFIGSGTLTPLSPLPRIPAPGVHSPGFDSSQLRAVYRFDGELIGPTSSTPLSHVIWVRVGCAGPWCGGFPSSGRSGVMALKHLPDYTLEAFFGACPGDFFDDPDGSVKARVQQCIRAGRCPER